MEYEDGVSDSLKSSYKNGLPAGPQAGAAKASETQAGIWVTLVGAILTVALLDQFTRLPWYITGPLAFVAGLLITVAYLQLKKFLFRK